MATSAALREALAYVVSEDFAVTFKSHAGDAS
jgi:hypothetical protein